MKKMRTYFWGIFVLAIFPLVAGCGTGGGESENPAISKTDTSPSGQTWTFTASVLGTPLSNDEILPPAVFDGQSLLLSDISVDVGENGLSGETMLSVSGIPADGRWGTISTASNKYENGAEVSLCEVGCGESVIISTQVGTPVGNHDITISVTRAGGKTLSSVHVFCVYSDLAPTICDPPDGVTRVF